MSLSDVFNLQVLAGLAGPFIGFLLGRAWQGTAAWTWSRVWHVVLVLVLGGLIVTNGTRIVSTQRGAQLAADERDRHFQEWQERLDQRQQEQRQVSEGLVRQMSMVVRAQAGSLRERALHAAKNFERVVDRIRRRDPFLTGRDRDVPFQTLVRRMDLQSGRSHAKCMKAGIMAVASIPGLPGLPASAQMLSPVDFCTNVLSMEEAAPRLMALADGLR
jgi:hypothetical protein